MTTKKKIDPWPTIAGILLIAIASVLVYSFSSSTNYKAQLNTLKVERDFLQAIVDNRQKQIDSLLNKINLFVQIDTIDYRESIINEIERKYEKNINAIYLNSRNKNIELLSRNLSERSSNK